MIVETSQDALRMDVRDYVHEFKTLVVCPDTVQELLSACEACPTKLSMHLRNISSYVERWIDWGQVHHDAFRADLLDVYATTEYEINPRYFRLHASVEAPYHCADSVGPLEVHIRLAGKKDL